MSNESDLKAFENGDILVGATILNNPDDDHAGDGRIIQYDHDLNLKGTLWTQHTTHLVGGLKFDKGNNLWAFDSQNYSVIKVAPTGEQIDQIDFGARSFSNACFSNSGDVYLGEHLVGDESNNKALEGPRKLGTVLPFMPDTDRYGDGNLYNFSSDGALKETYETETHGGMPGFLGVTASAFDPDESKIVYISELGNRIFQYDINNNQQMDDLITYKPDSGNMVIAISYAPNGDFYSIKANFGSGFALCKHDLENGEIIDEKILPGPGWASLCLSSDGNHAFIGNFFNGQIGKFDLISGQMIASVETNVERSLAGIAEFN
jgi:WD40 repeat protein